MRNSIAEKTASKKLNKKITAGVCVFVLCFFMFLQIFPFYLSFVQSLQPKSYRPSVSIRLLPNSLSLVNYYTAWKDSNLLAGYIWSFIYSASFTLCSAVLITLAAYVFAKKKFHGKGFIYAVFLSAMMVPGEILLVSNYILMTEIGLFKSPIGVVLPGVFSIYGMFMVRQYMHTVPDSVLESCIIDGAGDVKIIFKIILPLCLPIIATYSIITFIGQWNEYLWPQLVLNSVSPFDPIQIKLLLYRPVIDGSMTHPYAYSLRMAATMLALIPVLIFYFVFQRFFTEGISISGLK